MVIWHGCAEFVFGVSVGGTESGAKVAALQTLPRAPGVPDHAKRLDCGAFTASFGWSLDRHALKTSRSIFEALPLVLRAQPRSRKLKFRHDPKVDPVNSQP